MAKANFLQMRINLFYELKAAEKLEAPWNPMFELLVKLEKF